ncbi:uncharacterized protein LOC132722723 [Ruditapes philippinarum]|uniref:uncharacterized protein LOC132722723 n=1 Tax=Ruditapes philippinarum TaxID=129788 RepID=UPI00295A8E85|nr:uncharacterized protein LOC132722723 [Ruditapes philippinarum]
MIIESMYSWNQVEVARLYFWLIVIWLNNYRMMQLSEENFQRCLQGSEENKAEDNSCKSEEIMKDDNKGEVRWQPQATQLLVSMRIENDVKFHMQKTHSTLWDEISAVLKEKGYIFTGKQCSNKWKSLKRDYRAVVDHNSKTGSDKKTCKFFDDFNQLYGNKPSTRPSFTINSGSTTSALSNLQCTDAGSRSNAEVFASEIEDTTDSEEPPEKKPKTPGRKIKKKETGVVRMVSFLTSYQDAQKQMQEEHEMFVKEQNAEKLKRFDQLLDILAKK